MNKIAIINNWIALHTMTALSTMSCVYVFTIWALIPLVFPQTRDFVFYVSGGILQLSLLPAIMVGNNILNKNSEDRASSDHIALMNAVDDLQKIMAEESLEDNNITAIQTTLTNIQTRLDAIETNLVPRYQAPAPKTVIL
jgi:hypothetical protein